MICLQPVPASGEYYSKPVYWAYRKGITKGYSDGPYAGMFGVEVECLREQMITFLYRCHDYVTE